MSLSSGTLNLKFMQRAAARNAPSTPSGSGAGPGTPSSSSAPSRPPGPISTPSSILMKEDEGRWYLPSRSHIELNEAEDEEGWKFESSYMPFLQYEQEGRAGGGRMAFGGFGEAQAAEDGDEGGVDEEGEGVQDGLRGKGGTSKGGTKGDLGTGDETAVDTRKRRRPPTPPSDTKTFRRPAGFSPPPPPTSYPSSSRDPQKPLPCRPTSEPKPPRHPKPQQQPTFKLSTADKLRQAISTSRTGTLSHVGKGREKENEAEMLPPPATPAKVQAGSITRPIEVDMEVDDDIFDRTIPKGKKRKHPSSPMDPHPPPAPASSRKIPKVEKQSPPTPASTDSRKLDEREAELKAQRKKEKKQAKKARRLERKKREKEQGQGGAAAAGGDDEGEKDGDEDD